MVYEPVSKVKSERACSFGLKYVYDMDVAQFGLIFLCCQLGRV